MAMQKDFEPWYGLNSLWRRRWEPALLRGSAPAPGPEGSGNSPARAPGRTETVSCTREQLWLFWPGGDFQHHHHLNGDTCCLYLVKRRHFATLYHRVCARPHRFLGGERGAGSHGARVDDHLVEGHGDFREVVVDLSTRRSGHCWTCSENPVQRRDAGDLQNLASVGSPFLNAKPAHPGGAGRAEDAGLISPGHLWRPEVST